VATLLPALLRHRLAAPASLEANFALRALVGRKISTPDVRAGFASGLARARILREGGARSPSLREVEMRPVLVLGEDVDEPAPELALALRHRRAADR